MAAGTRSTVKGKKDLQYWGPCKRLLSRTIVHSQDFNFMRLRNLAVSKSPFRSNKPQVIAVAGLCKVRWQGIAHGERACSVVCNNGPEWPWHDSHGIMHMQTQVQLSCRKNLCLCQISPGNCSPPWQWQAQRCAVSSCWWSVDMPRGPALGCIQVYIFDDPKR